jgi:methyl-accepting chemotaxis protein
MMGNMKIGTKLLTGGILAVIAPLIIIGFVSVLKTTQSISSIETRNMERMSQSLANAIEMGLQEQLITIRDISYSNSAITAVEKVFREGAENSEREIALAQIEVTKIKDAAGDRFSSITLTSKRDGVIFASSDNGKYKGLDLSTRDYLKRAFKGEPNIGSVVHSKATGKLICTAACPVYSADGKEITGAAVMALWLKYFTDIIDAVKVGETGYAYLVNEDGYYITHPDEKKILTDTIFQIKGREALAEKIGKGDSGFIGYTAEGVGKIAAYATVPLTKWSVVTTIPKSEIFAHSIFVRNLIIGVGAIAFILAFVFFSFFSKGITRPLGNLINAVDRLGMGDTTVDIEVTSNDEVGQAMRSVQATINTMREIENKVAKVAEGDLTVTVIPRSDKDTTLKALAAMIENNRKQIQEIMGIVNTLASAASQIMATMAQVASGAAESATAVSETTTTVEEVKQTAEVSNQKAQHVSTTGRRAVEISRDGSQSVEDAIKGMNRVQEQMGSIADTVVSLSEQSQAIGEIIATVNDLTEQSNLLAVNASIEAAKAGEQGKGFSVVSQEMKNLAEQSKQATAQIRTILNDIQKGISSAVMATEQGAKSVDEGVKLAAAAGESIQNLSDSINEAAEAAVQIAASSQQQLVGMSQVGSAMENVKTASEQTAESTRQTEKSTQDLHGLGQQLQGMVSKYTV